MYEFGLFRKYHIPNFNGQNDNERSGSLWCFMGLGKVFAFASDSSMRKISPIAGWASTCLLNKNYLYLGNFSCENVEICYSRQADQSLWKGWILHQLQTNLQYLKSTDVQTS